MEELKSLVEVVTQNKISKINIIRHGHSNHRNQYEQLYQYIKNGKFNNKEEAAEHFFPNHPKKHIYFSNLKNRCKEKLINTIFFIETNQVDFNGYQRAYYSCVRLHCMANIMFGRFLRIPAVKLSERVLKKAIKYEFTEIVISLARKLKGHFGGMVGNRRKYLKYQSILNKYLDLQKSEIIAEEYIADIHYHLARSRENNREAIHKAKAYVSNLQRIIKKNHSNSLLFNFYLIKVTALQLQNKSLDTISVSEEALKHFATKADTSSPTIPITFNQRIIAAYINLRRFEDAQVIVKNYLPMNIEGTLNWYIGLQYYLISAFHSRDLDLAYDIVQKALAHKGFKKLYSNQSEEWHIYQGFVRYFVQVGRIKNRESRQRFRLQKFLNEVPVYSRDKRGANIPILIIQILFLLHQKKYGKIIDRVESIEMYVYRYLRRDETFRSNCFIKMLMQLPASSFHRAGVIRRADKYYKQLKASYFDPKASNLEIEIVPYELLWDCVLDSLENRHFRHRTKST